MPPIRCTRVLWKQTQWSRTCGCCGATWSVTAGRKRCTPTRRGCFNRRCHQAGRRKIPERRRKRRLDGRCGSWGLSGSQHHSPQAKGRVERCFGTLQDRLVKALRKAGVRTLEVANAYLEQGFLPMWNQRFVCAPASSVDGHRSLEKLDLNSILSVVETRRIGNDYTVPWRGRKWQIPREAIRRGMRGSTVRVEQRLNGSMVGRVQGQFTSLVRCPDATVVEPTPPRIPSPNRRFKPGPGQSRWMDQFRVKGNEAWRIYRQEQTQTPSVPGAGS